MKNSKKLLLLSLFLIFQICFSFTKLNAQQTGGDFGLQITNDLPSGYNLIEVRTQYYISYSFDFNQNLIINNISLNEPILSKIEVDQYSPVYDWSVTISDFTYDIFGENQVVFSYSLIVEAKDPFNNWRYYWNEFLQQRIVTIQ
ncbi:hypothetical protein Belba_1836 [Belliella baltica DSM 15883]|uniref:Uncharacterized protein n=1 Tax=Belliella baltica (strain DSM 15883 / CIP 108006 / LMG 21964 / BA134) TaxID=866536 RepID=I3Z5A7_BELBD|nr:hypothetical protein [Belliella baltica]AFL84425.1 hypothetical protein Belba_1836 [Belliella baltica DSM 15883]